MRTTKDIKTGMSCQTGCWALAAGVGFLAFVLLLVLGSTGIIGSLFIGLVLLVVLGFLFSWTFCTPLTKPGETPAPGVETSSRRMAAPAPTGDTLKSDIAPEPAPQQAPSEPPSAPAGEPRPTATGTADTPEAPGEKPSPAASTQAAETHSDGKVKATKDLPGQKDLSERKGTWKYEGGGAAPAAGAADTGTKPETLDAPRGGSADDLKKIRGVGPKLEETLNGLGIYHFDQIAAWSSNEVAWVDDNIEGFKGRATRDDWVGQARTLSGGT